MFVCEIMTGIGEEVWIGEIRGTMLLLLCVSSGPQEWSTTSSPKTFPSRFPTCLVQMSKTESLPKEKGEQEVDAGPQLSLAPTCPSPLLRKISQKLIHSNAVNLRHLHSSSKADPTDLS